MKFSTFQNNLDTWQGKSLIFGIFEDDVKTQLEKIAFIIDPKKLLEAMNKKKLEEFIHKNFKKIKIDKIHDFKSFKLKSLNLRSYYYKNILAFGDLLHRIHPLAGQGFNMTLRDIKVLIELIKYNLNLGIQLDSSVCVGFEMKSKSQNYLFSNGIDLIYEFFNLESKTKTKLMSKSVQFLGKNKSLNKLFTKLADTGISI